MAENPRTSSARDHDDGEMIDEASEDRTPGAIGHAGGRLATDIGTQDDLSQGLGDGADSSRPHKQDEIDNDTAYPADKRGARG